MFMDQTSALAGNTTAIFLDDAVAPLDLSQQANSIQTQPGVSLGLSDIRGDFSRVGQELLTYADIAKQVILTNQAGIVGNVFGAIAGAALLMTSSPLAVAAGLGISLAASAAIKVYNNRDFAAQSLDNLKQLIAVGMQEGILFRSLAAVGTGVAFGAIALTSGCLEHDPINIVGGNVTIANSSLQYVHGRNMTIGPDVYIGDNVHISGDNVTVAHSVLMGLPDEAGALPQHADQRGIYLMGNNNVFNNTTMKVEIGGVEGESYHNEINLRGDNNIFDGMTMQTTEEPCNGISINGNNNVFTNGTNLSAQQTLYGRGNVFDNAELYRMEVRGDNNLIIGNGDTPTTLSRTFIDGSNVTVQNSDISASNIAGESTLVNAKLEYGNRVEAGASLNNATIKENVFVNAGATIENTTVEGELPGRTYINPSKKFLHNLGL